MPFSPFIGITPDEIISGWPRVQETLETLEKSGNKESGQGNPGKVREFYEYLSKVREFFDFLIF